MLGLSRLLGLYVRLHAAWYSYNIPSKFAHYTIEYPLHILRSTRNNSIYSYIF